MQFTFVTRLCADGLPVGLRNAFSTSEMVGLKRVMAATGRATAGTTGLSNEISHIPHTIGHTYLELCDYPKILCVGFNRRRVKEKNYMQCVWKQSLHCLIARWREITVECERHDPTHSLGVITNYPSRLQMYLKHVNVVQK